MLAARMTAGILCEEQIGEERESVAIGSPMGEVEKLNVLKRERQRVDLADSTRCDCDVDERGLQVGGARGWGRKGRQPCFFDFIRRMFSFSTDFLYFCSQYCMLNEEIA